MKKWPLGCLALVLAAVILACFCGAAYTWPKPRATPVDLQGLLMDTSAFPPGWRLQFGPANPPPGKHLKDELEALYVQFVATDSSLGATHAVLRYRNSVQAAVSFWTTDEFSKESQLLTAWTVPKGWTYTSATADRFRFACAEFQGLDRFVSCHAVAQYEEYISVFHIRMSPGHMTPDDLAVILRAIDERMAHELGRAER